MTLPSGLTTVTATGTWTTHTGVAAKGSVSFVPTNPRLVYEPDPTVLVGAPVIVDMDSTGSVTAELIPTDSPDILGGDWNYTVTVYFNNGPSAPDLKYSFSMDVLAAGGNIDLTDFAPPVDPPSPGATYVLSVNGFSGHIQVEAIVSDTWGSSLTVQGDFTAEQDVTVGGDLTLSAPVAVSVNQALGTTLSTGVVSGGDISTNGLDPAALDISAVVAHVVDTLTDPTAPTVTVVSQPAKTVSLDAQGLLRTLTWWLMDSTGAIVQQADRPTNTQRRTHAVLGVTAQASGIIFVAQSLPVILSQQANQLADLMDALGPFSVTGNRITPNGANLMINQSAGQLFSRAANHFAGAVLTNDPHINPTFAQTPAQYRYITATALAFGPLVNLIDVANFDNGGVITPIGGGTNSSTIHRVFLFSTSTADAQLAIQYGQTVYGSLSAAVDSIGTTGFMVNPVVGGSSTLIAWIAATRTATDLSNPAQAQFALAGRFATP